MVRERVTWIAAAATLLMAGLLLARSSVYEAPAIASYFRVWFWDGRALDLAVQAVAVVIGALGIAALRTEESEDAK